jgi:hypothetical protein
MFAPQPELYSGEQYPAATYAVDVHSGRSSNFKKLNCCACLCAVAIFAVTIAAASVSWYKYQQTTQATTIATTTNAVTQTYTLNYTRFYFDLQGKTTVQATANTAETSVFASYNSDSSSIWSVFKLCQAFVLIALLLSGIISFFLALCFADVIRNKLLFLAGMNVLRVTLLIVGTLILISLVIAFLGFLGITNAFNSDSPSCNYGYCRRFIDSVKDGQGTQTVTVNGVAQPMDVTVLTSWGAVEGWYLDLGCIPVAILLIIIVVLNKFPIPVDSVGSGEAL